mgnify:CR=1 FL=1
MEAPGRNVVEVRSSGMHKGMVVERLVVRPLFEAPRVILLVATEVFQILPAVSLLAAWLAAAVHRARR